MERSRHPDANSTLVGASTPLDHRAILLRLPLPHRARLEWVRILILVIGERQEVKGSQLGAFDSAAILFYAALTQHRLRQCALRLLGRFCS
jgi:hypothetical protein